MAMEPDSPFAELFKLTAAERIQLAEDLWDSVAANPNDDTMPLSEDQLAEVGRRIREHIANPSSALPWEDVRARLWSKAG
jgi:putative addiction module component (TIGR02574 family)